MPQLLSRMDDSGWLTPSIADILEAGAPPPGEDTVRAQAQELRQTMAAAGTPARILDVHQTPAYTLYITAPEQGRRGGKRAGSVNDFQTGLKQLSQQHKDWTIGFLPQVRDNTSAAGIIVRTPQHRPLRLRQLLVSNTFRDYSARLALTMGVTLEQQLIIRDLEKTGHLLVIGSGTAKRHFLQGILLTLILLNTPAELRIALAGSHSDTHDALLETPHVLGRLMSSPDDAQRLLDGLVKEIVRRRGYFRDSEVRTFEEYNSRLKERGEPPLPRILLMIDSMSDPSWQANNDRWPPSVYDLLVNGARVGIHLVLAADELKSPDVPHILDGTISTQVILRSAAKDIVDTLDNFHKSTLRFVDAFVLSRGKITEITPVALAAVPDDEMERAVAYWQQSGAQRKQEKPNQQLVPSSGVTGYLKMTPEVAAALAERDNHASKPSRPSAGVLARAAQKLSGMDDESILQRGRALAAYLGWLGVGPLQDVLGLSMSEAQTVMTTLQDEGIIELGDAPMLRFVRLANNPFTLEPTPELKAAAPDLPAPPLDSLAEATASVETETPTPAP
ncbi:MAG: hypothetical protein H7175_12240 [Burkholderiales bacterium]|nr:hypothetical protein [Anaerolineae bacterium]